MANRTAALLANMAATTALVDSMIAKAKGQPLPAKEEPKALENGSRAYTVSDWIPSCSKCGRSGCDKEPRECGQATWFPIFHLVNLVVRAGAVVSATCREGRRPGGEPCSKAECKHISRAKDAWSGLPSKGVDLAAMYGMADSMPKCPNCRETWSVSRAGDAFECRNPVCVRDGKPWRFEEGSTAKPPPMRHDLVVRDREPGRVVRKQSTTKRWGAL